MSYIFRVTCLSALVAVSACTAGGVGVAGNNGTITPMAGATVSVHTCVANKGIVKQTVTTDSKGQFVFYGENADGSINDATYVPAGQVTMWVDSPGTPAVTNIYQFQHTFDQTCPTLSGTIPCSKDQLMWTFLPVDPVSAGVHVRYPVSVASRLDVENFEFWCNHLAGK